MTSERWRLVRADAVKVSYCLKRFAVWEQRRLGSARCGSVFPPVVLKGQLLPCKLPDMSFKRRGAPKTAFSELHRHVFTPCFQQTPPVAACSYFTTCTKESEARSGFILWLLS